MSSDQHHEPLAQLGRRFADAIDDGALLPASAVRQTTSTPFQAGIGPHTETATIALVMQELAAQGHLFRVPCVPATFFLFIITVFQRKKNCLRYLTVVWGAPEEGSSLPAGTCRRTRVPDDTLRVVRD